MEEGGAKRSMKATTTFKVLLAVVGLALSLFFAMGGSSIQDNLGIRTPGMLASDALVPPKPYPHQFAAVGEGLRTQIFVDWIFWFVVMYLIYFVVKRLCERSNDRR